MQVPFTLVYPIIHDVHIMGLLASQEAPHFDGHRTHFPFGASTYPKSQLRHLLLLFKSQLIQFFPQNNLTSTQDVPFKINPRLQAVQTDALVHDKQDDGH